MVDRSSSSTSYLWWNTEEGGDLPPFEEGADLQRLISWSLPPTGEDHVQSYDDPNSCLSAAPDAGALLCRGQSSLKIVEQSGSADTARNLTDNSSVASFEKPSQFNRRISELITSSKDAVDGCAGASRRRNHIILPAHDTSRTSNRRMSCGKPKKDYHPLLLLQPARSSR